jgi:hypothetical protein
MSSTGLAPEHQPALSSGGQGRRCTKFWELLAALTSRSLSPTARLHPTPQVFLLDTRWIFFGETYLWCLGDFEHSHCYWQRFAVLSSRGRLTRSPRLRARSRTRNFWPLETLTHTFPLRTRLHF